MQLHKRVEIQDSSLTCVVCSEMTLPRAHTVVQRSFHDRILTHNRTKVSCINTAKHPYPSSFLTTLASPTHYLEVAHNQIKHAETSGHHSADCINNNTPC